MTGIMGSEDETIQEQQQQQHEAVHLQQPRLETKTLKKGEVKNFFVKLTCNFFFVNYTETKSNINMVVYFLVPGDSSWVVLDSNGSSNNSKEGENNFFPVKLYNIFENMILKSFFFSQKESQGTLQEDNIDIFSQAMASAEIDEFAANNSK